jgi:hypothetical protein
VLQLNGFSIIVILYLRIGLGYLNCDVVMVETLYGVIDWFRCG